MSDSNPKIRLMTDSEFDEWTDVRSRSMGYFRRKCFIINSKIAGIAVAILATIKYTDIAPDWIRLLLPDVVIPGMFVVPFLTTFVFGPMIWQLQEERYTRTLELRATTELTEVVESRMDDRTM